MVPFSIQTPINPKVREWVYTIPTKYREHPSLMDCLLRLAPGIYHDNLIGENVNPFYKIIEILGEPQLYYHNLQKIKEYYNLDLISYLTKGNRGEYYIHYSCRNSDELKIALDERHNSTNEDTLTNILSNLI